MSMDKIPKYMVTDEEPKPPSEAETAAITKLNELAVKIREAERGSGFATRLISAFEKELASLINRESVDAASSTHDFVLARYLNDCLQAFNRVRAWEAKLASQEGVPVEERNNGPRVDLL